MVYLARDSKVGGSSFGSCKPSGWCSSTLRNAKIGLRPVCKKIKSQIIGSCMPDLRHPAQWHPIVVPEGPGCFQCQGLKGFSGVQAIMDTVLSCQIFFRQAVAFWSQKVVRKGDVHQIPTGQPNTNGWFCRRINQFPLVSAGQICRFAATETTAGLKKTWRNRCGSYLTRVFRWTTQGR